jgi:hypothetical protein
VTDLRSVRRKRVVSGVINEYQYAAYPSSDYVTQCSTGTGYVLGFRVSAAGLAA